MKQNYVISMVMVTLSTVMLVANQKTLSFDHLPAGVLPAGFLCLVAVLCAARHGVKVLTKIMVFIAAALCVARAIFALAIAIPAATSWPYAKMYTDILTIPMHRFAWAFGMLLGITVIALFVGGVLLRRRHHQNPPVSTAKQYRYFTLIGMVFVLVLLLSNITTQKVVHVGWIVVDVGTFYFPVTYIFNNIFTEVYGYSASRKLIWTGLMCNIMMIVFLQITVYLPHAASWHQAHAYAMIAGNVPRIVFASIIGFFCGEFLNSYVLAKLKILTKGKKLWTRTIGSTIVGNAADSLMFNLFAFFLVIPLGLVFQVAAWQYALKVGYEIIATPLTYLIVLTLKKREQEDYFDYKTNFNPFLV